MGYADTNGDAADQAFIYGNCTEDLHWLNRWQLQLRLRHYNRGQVVGVSSNSGGTSHAFRTAANQPINATTDDLGTLGGNYSYAAGINDSGQVAGNSTLAGVITHAFRTTANEPINPSTDDLGTLGGMSSWAYAINDSGQVAGYSVTSLTSSGYAYHAFRTAPNQSINPATDDLGTFGGQDSYAYGINNIGQVVGAADVGGSYAEHAFVHGGSGSLSLLTDDLGTLGGLNSEALAINNEGLIVGDAYTTGNAEHAFLYCDGSMQDLNNLIAANSGWTLTAATAINNFDQIVGYGTVGGVTHAFLLTTVPEPSTLTLLGGSAVGLVGYCLRRRRQSGYQRRRNM